MMIIVYNIMGTRVTVVVLCLSVTALAADISRLFVENKDSLCAG